MSVKNLLLLIFSMFASYVQAACYIDPNFAPNMTLTLPPITMMVDADASTSVPIYTAKTDVTGQKISWINCDSGYKVGRDVYSLTGYDPATFTYATNIPGIRVKPLYSNGAGEGTFPREQLGPCGDMDPNLKCRINFAPNNYFKLEFYKTLDSLNLSNKNGDLVLPAGDMLYYWIEFKTPQNQSLKLYVNEIKIVSTPVCKVSDSINIDYGKITSRTLAAEGIEKPLDFYISCKTDYGSYSASAYINTDTPSANSKYIKVKDASGSSEKLGIKIKNSEGDDLALNSPDSFEMKSSNASESRANFNWKAILFPLVPGVRPTSGAFSAQAQITFNIN